MADDRSEDLPIMLLPADAHAWAIDVSDGTLLDGEDDLHELYEGPFKLEELTVAMVGSMTGYLGDAGVSAFLAIDPETRNGVIRVGHEAQDDRVHHLHQVTNIRATLSQYVMGELNEYRELVDCEESPEVSVTVPVELPESESS